MFVAEMSTHGTSKSQRDGMFQANGARQVANMPSLRDSMDMRGVFGFYTHIAPPELKTDVPATFKEFSIYRYSKILCILCILSKNNP
jgi:hypothetical protein